MQEFDERRELRTALWLTLAVLAVLTAVKPLGGIAIVGSVAFTFAAIIQLWLPMWRADKLGLGNPFIGLSLKAWRVDLRFVGILVAVTFPPYIVVHHLYMTNFHEWANAVGLQELARYIPSRELAPTLPQDVGAWLAAGWWFLQIVATHSLGVALPEETFYRGYLQPRLETLWPPKKRLWGVPMGRAAIVAALLFALGHFLGEWNPMRLGPFFPALAFAWLRNASGTVLGAITFHAACNVLGEILFSLYQPS